MDPASSSDRVKPTNIYKYYDNLENLPPIDQYWPVITSFNHRLFANHGSFEG